MADPQCTTAPVVRAALSGVAGFSAIPSARHHLSLASKSIAPEEHPTSSKRPGFRLSGVTRWSRWAK